MKPFVCDRLNDIVVLYRKKALHFIFFPCNVTVQYKLALINDCDIFFLFEVKLRSGVCVYSLLYVLNCGFITRCTFSCNFDSQRYRLFLVYFLWLKRVP